MRIVCQDLNTYWEVMNVKYELTYKKADKPLGCKKKNNGNWKNNSDQCNILAETLPNTAYGRHVQSPREKKGETNNCTQTPEIGLAVRCFGRCGCFVLVL